MHNLFKGVSQKLQCYLCNWNQFEQSCVTGVVIDGIAEEIYLLQVIGTSQR